jgi:hypothetical protein
MSYLPQGETAEFFIDFNTLSVGAGSVTVTVNGGNDPDASNDSIEFSVEVPGSADLESMVSVDPGQSQVEGAEVFRLNQPVSFSASIENLATASATGVETRVRFDSDTTDHQINWPGVSCVIDILPYWFVCDVGTLAPGEQRAFGVSLRTPATGRANGSSSGVFVSINVDGDQSDPNLANNQSNASVTVAQAIFDLELGVTGADPIVVGELAAVEISLRNLGPDAAREVSLDTYHLSLLPPELEVLSASSDSAVCSLNEFTRQLFCDPIDSLASGETLQVAIELRASEPLRFRFEVGYTFRGYETIPANGRTAFELVAKEPAPEPEPEPESEPEPAPAPAPAPAPTPSQPSSSGGGGGGGGGGALDWLSLLLLAVARWRFRARQADCSRRRRTAGAGNSRRA